MAYTISATTKGGRNGRAILENGGLAFAMALQKEFGGAGDGHNPEQLFALGWSSCFGQAILLLAKKHGLDGQDARVTCFSQYGQGRRELRLQGRDQGGAARRRQDKAARR